MNYECKLGRKLQFTSITSVPHRAKTFENIVLEKMLSQTSLHDEGQSESRPMLRYIIYVH